MRTGVGRDWLGVMLLKMVLVLVLVLLLMMMILLLMIMLLMIMLQMIMLLLLLLFEVGMHVALMGELALLSGLCSGGVTRQGVHRLFKDPVAVSELQNLAAKVLRSKIGIIKGK
jgi:hypothetical protein